jgi:hypothetical protein
MRSRFLLLTILLLVVLGGYAYAETKPRKFGILFRDSKAANSSNFVDDEKIEYVKSDNKVSSQDQLIPVALQLDEDLLRNWASTSWFVSLEQIFVEDMAPVLKGITYGSLLSTNQSNNGSKNFSITSAQTNIDQFTQKHPEYKSQIDALSEPSLSGDLNLRMLVVGKSWGVFIPIGERHRLLLPEGGVGVGYTEGHYAVNLCDPYIVEGEPTKHGLLGIESHKGICSKKSELFAGRLSHFGAAFILGLGLYSYIGENFEFNFFKMTSVTNILPAQTETTLYPRISVTYLQLASIVYAF